MPWFTGMGDSLLFFYDKISLFSLVNHECIDHQVSQSGIECTTNVLFFGRTLSSKSSAVTKRKRPGIFPGYYGHGPRLLSREIEEK